MGSLLSSNNTDIDSSILEEAMMFSSATREQCKRWYIIFHNACKMEKMTDDHFERNVKNMNLKEDAIERVPHTNTSTNTYTATMRFEEFLCIPEFTFSPFASELFHFAIHREPHFENETRLSYTKFCVLLQILAHNGSIPEKTKLAFFLIAGHGKNELPDKVTRTNLKNYIRTISSDGLSDESLNHATEQIFSEIKNENTNSHSNPNLIMMNEYMRCTSVADDFASKIFVELKMWSTKQMIKRRAQRMKLEIEQKARNDKERLQEEETQQKLIEKIEREKMAATSV
jgi:hypothetical protein